MFKQRWRPVFLFALGVVLVWASAAGGLAIIKGSMMTVEKVRAYVASVDFARLSAADRVEAIHRLAEKLNALSAEERRRAQFEHVTQPWLEVMSTEEKGEYLAGTSSTRLTQVITAFEQLPEDRRRRTVEDVLRRLRDRRTKLAAEEGMAAGTNGFPAVTPELLLRIRTLGLAGFYKQSSAETKAELAPILEELQHVMESGRPFRGR